MRHRRTIGYLVEVVPLLAHHNHLSPKDVCILQCCCKALRSLELKWIGYPATVKLRLAQPSAVVWLTRHGDQLQQLCFEQVWEPLLRNILADLKRKNSLSYLEIIDVQLLHLPSLPGALQELKLSCPKLHLLPNLPQSLLVLDCAACAALSVLPRPLPARLQRLCVGCEWLRKLPPLPASLTELQLSSSRLKQLGSGQHTLPTALKVLSCRDCEELEELVGLPAGLQHLKLENCLLENIGSLSHVTALQQLHLIECPGLSYVPQLPVALTGLWCDGVEVETLPTLPDGLLELHVSSSEELRSLPSLPSSLTCVELDNCPRINMKKLPQGLLRLDVSSTPWAKMATMPKQLTAFSCTATPGITKLPKFSVVLQELRCTACPHITSLAELPSNLTKLDCNLCTQLKSLPAQLPASLKELDCFACPLSQLPDPLPRSLSRLCLGKTPLLKQLPTLPGKLEALIVGFCPELKKLPALPHGLTLLSINECPIQSLRKRLPAGLECLECLNCTRVAQLPDMRSATKLTRVDVSGCSGLTALCPSGVPASLTAVIADGCTGLTELPDLSGTKLRNISLRQCSSLQHMPAVPFTLRPEGISHLPSCLATDLIEQRSDFEAIPQQQGILAGHGDSAGLGSDADYNDADSDDNFLPEWPMLLPWLPIMPW